MIDRRIYYTNTDVGHREVEVAQYYRHHGMGVCCALRLVTRFGEYRGSQFMCDNAVPKDANCWSCDACQRGEQEREGASDGWAAVCTSDYGWRDE